MDMCKKNQTSFSYNIFFKNLIQFQNFLLLNLWLFYYDPLVNVPKLFSVERKRKKLDILKMNTSVGYSFLPKNNTKLY